MSKQAVGGKFEETVDEVRENESIFGEEQVSNKRRLCS